MAKLQIKIANKWSLLDCDGSTDKIADVLEEHLDESIAFVLAELYENKHGEIPSDVANAAKLVAEFLSKDSE